MKKSIILLIIPILYAFTSNAQPSDPPYTSKMADLGEIQLQYMDFGGEGPTVIWVQDFHNYFEGPYFDSTYFSYFAALSNHARVLAPLRRGYGKSTDTQWGYDVATQGDDLLRFMDALGIEKAILFGRQPANQDMTWIAEHHPERLAGLVYWGNPILIVGCGYPDELILMENWSAFAPDFEKEKEKRVVMSRAFWRPHFLDDTMSRIQVPTLRLLNPAFEEISVIRNISTPERMKMWTSEEAPGYEAELAALKSLAKDSARYEKLREHLKECDPSEDLDRGMERTFGANLQSASRPCLYESEEESKAQLDWIFEQLTGFTQKLEVPHKATFPAIEDAPFPYVEPHEVGIPDEKINRLRQEVLSWVENGDLISNEILIIKDEKVIFHEAFGWSDREEKIPVQRNSFWNIRSMTKPITATVAMMLEEDGILSLNDKVIKHIPEFKGNQETTIGQMLSHTSGYASRDFADYDSTIHTLEQWVMTGVLKEPTGTYGQYEYTDFGLVVTCYIIGKVTGKSLQEHIEERIIKPLGLEHTRVNFSDDPEWRKRINTWYEIDEETMEYQINWPRNRPAWTIFGGAWGMFSTVTDFAQFIRFFNQKGNWAGQQLLTEEHAAEMISPQGYRNGIPMYGYGWMLQAKPGDPGTILNFGHRGGDALAGYYFPPENMIVIYLSHSRHGNHREAFMGVLNELELVRFLSITSGIAPEAYTGKVNSITEEAKARFCGIYADPDDPIGRMEIASKGDHLCLNMFLKGQKAKRTFDLAWVADNQFVGADFRDGALDWIAPNIQVIVDLVDGKAETLVLKSGDNIVFSGKRVGP